MNDFQPRINMLSPRAGDTIVLHLDADRLSKAQREAVRAAVLPLLPAGVKAMVVGRDVTLTHIAANDVDVEQAPEPIHFDTWMRGRTEQAHREFMDRTSHILNTDFMGLTPDGARAASRVAIKAPIQITPPTRFFSTEEIARYMGAPIA